MVFKALVSIFVSGLLLNLFSFKPEGFSDFKKEPNYSLIAFYNVENLFDTLDDPHKNDNEFLPDSKKKWNSERYSKKLNDLAQAMYSIDSTNLPVVFGLAEVENEAVVKDLINTPLLHGKYEVIHKESPDFRGIDVAVIYQPEKFTLTHKEWIRFQLPDKTRPSTRDIVYVQGLILKKDTLNFFFCHWPSRYGGTEETMAFRAKAASELRIKVDSLLKINPSCKIVIMGDLNDHPEDKSVQTVLNAKKATEVSDLVNLMWKYKEKNEGSYFYKGNWGVLDHIIISKGIFDAKKGMSANESSAFVYKADFLLYTDKKGVQSPGRTYGGTNYYGGYSDHLPVYLKLSN